MFETHDRGVGSTVAVSTDAETMLSNISTKHPTIKHVSFRAVDYYGLIREHMAPLRIAQRLARTGTGMGVVHPFLQILTPSGGFRPDLSATGRATLLPDWSSLAVCPARPSYASVMCNMVSPQGDLDTCPRAALQSVLERSQKQHALDILVGFEIEFMVLASPEAPLGREQMRGAGGTSAAARDAGFSVLERAVDLLEDAGVHVWVFHSEWGSAQYEIATEPLPPLQAVDALYTAIETIKGVAHAQGLHATLAPKPFDGLTASANGLHMHLSVNARSDAMPVPQQTADAFLEGMFRSLPATMALCMATHDSYERTKIFGDYLTWGDENRLTALRRIEPAHWECRFIDSTANMYLAAAALIGTGFRGIEEKLTLSTKGRTQKKPIVQEDEHQELGKLQKFPISFKDALKNLRDDRILPQVLGQSAVADFLRVQEHEADTSAKTERQERFRLARLLY